MGTSGGRRGRLPAGEIEARQDAVLDAAMVELTEHGYDKATMLSIARRAGASKETLYAWFGNREGLFAALIRRNADRSFVRVNALMSSDQSETAVLEAFAGGLVQLLTSEESVAINRLAMTSPALRQVLLREGRFRTGETMERFLGSLMERGTLRADDTEVAFRLLYGLIVEDRQIRALLGEEPPTRQELDEHARHAVQRFLDLMQRTD